MQSQEITAYVLNKVQEFLSRGSIANMVVMFIITLSMFVPPYVQAALVLLLLVMELRPIRKFTGITYKKNLLLYFLPVACAANIQYMNASMVYHHLSVITSIMMAFLAIGYDSLWGKLSKYSLVSSRMMPNDQLETRFDIARHYLLLLAIFINIFYPVGAITIFIFLSLALLAKIIHTIITRKRVARYQDRVIEDIEKMAPKFIVMYSLAKPAYNVYTMWDKYFAATGEPFLVMTPQWKHFDPLQKLVRVPIVFARGSREMERVLDIPSVKAVFYPTNSPHNMNALMSTSPFHVHIGHGDSDKATSYRSVTAMYDRIFVAGQEAIDRYENHGVHIEKEKFMIVGRPQIEDVEQSRGKVESVLYAPTWHGDTEVMDYTSLYLGKEIIEELLNKNLRVIFRPHPNSRLSPKLSRIINEVYDMLAENSRLTGLDHVYGVDSESSLSIVDCFNLSDALISDVSSVTSDYLYSNKPIVLIAMKESIEDFKKSNPVARGAYVVDNNLTEFDKTVDDLAAGRDRLLKRRADLKKRYLSGVSKGKYSDLFVSSVRQILEATNPRNLS